jgi:hypothetical protein
VTIFLLCDPAFGDSDDEDIEDVGGNQDIEDVGENLPDGAGIFCMTYCVVCSFTYYT